MTVLVIPGKKILKEGYLSKSFVGSILYFIIIRVFLENKVETLTIYKLIKIQRIWRDTLREETTQRIEVEKD